MLTASLLISIGLLATSPIAELPDGWRAPTDAELVDPMLSDSPEALTRVAGDLNGDSVEDIALLLKSTRDSAEALWVHLSDLEQTRWVLLHQTSWGPEYPDVGLSMRIDRAAPGSYECLSTGQRHYFSTSGIKYFRLGSSSSVFFWSDAKGEFQQVWISD